MTKLSRQHLTVAAATAAAAIGGTQIAGAADKAGTSGTAAQSIAQGYGYGGPGGPGGRGHRGGGRIDTAAIAKSLGVTEDQLDKALDAARDANAPKDRADRGAERAAALATALGVETSAVQKILDASRPERGARGDRGPGARPDDTALVSALAKGLSKSEADVKAALTKVQEAHRAEHEAREDALYAAVAKSLNTDAAAVEKAFEAARPQRPTK